VRRRVLRRADLAPDRRRVVPYQEGAINRADLRKGFEFGGITWENYRGSVAGTNFFPDTQAFVVPEGTSIFTTYYAPADFMEAVNTLGLPLYSKLISDDELNRWVKLHSQSNPLAINACARARWSRSPRASRWTPPWMPRWMRSA
jgi:hypothetical protein